MLFRRLGNLFRSDPDIQLGWLVALAAFIIICGLVFGVYSAVEAHSAARDAAQTSQNIQILLKSGKTSSAVAAKMDLKATREAIDALTVIEDELGDIIVAEHIKIGKVSCVANGNNFTVHCMLAK